MGWCPPWWKEWTGGAGWNPQPPTLHGTLNHQHGTLNHQHGTLNHQHGTLNHQRYRDNMLPWATVFLDETFCISKTMQRHTQHVTRLIFWHNRRWRSWTDELEVQPWNPFSMFRTKWLSGSETWMAPPTSTVPKLSWWRHQMETFSVLLALCAGNSPVSGEFPSQRPVTRSCDVFVDLCPN